MPQDRRIPLNLPMSFDNRNTETNSVVNSKWLDYKGALFPRADFETEDTANDVEIEKFIAGDGLWAIGDDGTDSMAFYSVTSAGASFSMSKRAGASNNFRDAVYYYDGTDEFIYGIDSTGDVWKFNTDTYVFTDNVQNLTSGSAQLIEYHPATDSLYVIVNDRIYSQTGTTWNGVLRTLPENFTYKQMVPYKDWMVIVAEKNGTDEVRAFFYDVINNPADSFAYNKLVSNGNYVHMTVLEGKLSAVIESNYYGNNKEYDVLLSYRQYDGVNFVEINTIPFKDSISVSSENSDDSLNMYICVVADTPEFNGVYRFNSNGTVTIAATTDRVNDADGSYHGCIFYKGRLLIGYEDTAGSQEIGRVRDGSSSGYNDYDDRSVYITPMLEDPYENKHMTSVYMSFQETYDGSEEGWVYYRTSKRDTWTEILHFDAGVDGDSDRKQIVYNNTDDLPDFKEIQFKIESRRGLNITAVGYKFDFINDDHE